MFGKSMFGKRKSRVGRDDEIIDWNAWMATL